MQVAGQLAASVPVPVPIAPPLLTFNSKAQCSTELYCDLISESSRACAIFSRLNHLPVDIKWISIKRKEHLTPQLAAANPLGKVPILLEFDTTTAGTKAPAPSSAPSSQPGPQASSTSFTTHTLGHGQAQAGAAATPSPPATLSRSPSSMIAGPPPGVVPASVPLQPPVQPSANSSGQPTPLSSSTGSEGLGVAPSARQAVPAPVRVGPPGPPVQGAPPRGAAPQAQPPPAQALSEGGAGARGGAAPTPNAGPGPAPAQSSTSQSPVAALGAGPASATLPGGQPLGSSTQSAPAAGSAGAAGSSTGASTGAPLPGSTGAGHSTSFTTSAPLPPPVQLPGTPLFSIGEACAILTYLARKHMVADHWYPSELRAKTKVDAALHWQQRALRAPADRLLAERVVRAQNSGHARYEAEVAEAEKGVCEALSLMERVWLGNSPFMTGDAPALCDLVCACILEQLRLLDTVKEKPDYSDIVKPYPKVQAWLERVGTACKPHFNDVHASMRAAVQRAHLMVAQQRSAASSGAPGMPPPALAAAVPTLAASGSGQAGASALPPYMRTLSALQQPHRPGAPSGPQQGGQQGMGAQGFKGSFSSLFGLGSGGR